MTLLCHFPYFTHKDTKTPKVLSDCCGGIAKKQMIQTPECEFSSFMLPCLTSLSDDDNNNNKGNSRKPAVSTAWAIH